MVHATALTIFLLMTMMSGMEGRSLSNAKEIFWEPGIGKDCQAACPTPLVFSTAFSNHPPAYSCQVYQISGLPAPGFQSTAGQCTADLNGTPVTSSSYDCGCLNANAQTGLDKPGSDCSTACSNVDGFSGNALTDGTGFICMASTEMGKTNHFGTAKNGKCEFVSGVTNTVSATTDYSCVCSFAQSSKTAG